MASGQMIDFQAIGLGLLFDRTNDVQLPNFVSFTCSCEVENLVVPIGDQVTDQKVPIRQVFSGHVDFREMNASVIAALTGGSAAAATVKWTEREQETIATGVVTVSGDILYTDAVQIENITNGFRYRLVTAAPSEGEAQVGTPTADDITFNVAENDDIVKVSFFSTVAGAGETVTVETTDLPSAFDLLCWVRAYDRLAGAYLSDGFGLSLATCKRTGTLDLPAVSVREMSTFGMDFEVEGDVTYFTPST